VVEELFIDTNWMAEMGIVFPQQFCWCVASTRNALLCVSELHEEGSRAGFVTQITFQILPTLMKMWRRQRTSGFKFLVSLSVCSYVVPLLQTWGVSAQMLLCDLHYHPTKFQLCKKELKHKCMLVYSFIINYWTGCKKIQV
jgi:hypothetical protein